MTEPGVAEPAAGRPLKLASSGAGTDPAGSAQDEKGPLHAPVWPRFDDVFLAALPGPTLCPVMPIMTCPPNLCHT